MDLLRSFAFAAILVMASCSPETYMPPFPEESPDQSTTNSIAWTPFSPGMDGVTSALPILRFDAPYGWTGCHGEGRMTFRDDATMTWEIDGQSFDSGYLLDAGECLYPGCEADCENMIAYRYDDGREAWRQWDGTCWYDIQLLP